MDEENKSQPESLATDETASSNQLQQKATTGKIIDVGIGCFASIALPLVINFIFNLILPPLSEIIPTLSPEIVQTIQVIFAISLYLVIPLAIIVYGIKKRKSYLIIGVAMGCVVFPLLVTGACFLILFSSYGMRT